MNFTVGYALLINKLKTWVTSVNTAKKPVLFKLTRQMKMMKAGY
jgi:hypothetical protein